MSKTLVVGALGVVGRANVEYLSGLQGWEVVALSRRAPDFQSRALFVSADLMDKAACRAALKGHSDITHVIFAALHEQASLVAGWTEADHIRVNLEMLKNTLDVVEEISPGFKHLALMHGGKAYGVHLGPPPLVPSRESDPRTMPPNFYYDQEDLLRARQRGKAWNFTIFRPPAVVGFAVGSPMNAILTVGLYAAIRRTRRRCGTASCRSISYSLTRWRSLCRRLNMPTLRFAISRRRMSPCKARSRFARRALRSVSIRRRCSCGNWRDYRS